MRHTGDRMIEVHVLIESVRPQNIFDVLGILILGVHYDLSNEDAERQQHPKSYEKQRCYYSPKPAFHFAHLSYLLVRAPTVF